MVCFQESWSRFVVVMSRGFGGEGGCRKEQAVQDGRKLNKSKKNRKSLLVVVVVERATS